MFHQTGQLGARTYPGLGRLNYFEYQWVKRDGNERAGQDKTLRLNWQEPERDAKRSQDKRKLANLRKLADTVRAVFSG